MPVEGGGAAHTAYLQTLQGWLRRTRLPGDMQRLHQTIRILRGLELTLDEDELAEMRGLLCDCFNVGPAQLDDLLLEDKPVTQPVLSRGFMPNVGGYVQDYVEAVSGQESPAAFHAMALLAAIGAALGRQTWLDLTFFKVWPNISVVLTGPAGGPRKTTACEMAVETVETAFEGWRTELISDATPQALVEELGSRGEDADAVGFLYAPEFRHFFPSQQFMEGAIPLITRLLDNPGSYPVARITRRCATLRNVTLSILGGSTLDWLAKMPSDVQGGGFLTRVMLVHEEAASGVAARPERGKQVSASAALGRIRDVAAYAAGEVKLSPAAERWYDAFYKDLKSRTQGHPRLILYYNRKQSHLLKVALLMNLPKKRLEVGDLEKALALLDWIEQPLADVYRLIGLSKSGEFTKAVLDMLRAHGGKMHWAGLAREMKGLLNARDFRMAVETLKQAGQLKELRSGAEHLVILRELNLVE